MLENVNSSLKSLEKSFMLSYKEVSLETENLRIALKEFDHNDNELELKKTEVHSITKKIEELSIKNEYKLNLIKDFPEYYSSIKYRKK